MKKLTLKTHFSKIYNLKTYLLNTISGFGYLIGHYSQWTFGQIDN